MTMITADDIVETLRTMENEEQRNVLTRFFKTGRGEYGEGDMFLGLKVPQTRSVTLRARLQVPLHEIARLLDSPWHEARLCGLLLLVEEMKAATPRRRDSPTLHAERRAMLAEFYLSHTRRVNNWDLVDLSCQYSLGPYMLLPGTDGTMPSRGVLDRLAASDNLWEQRIAIVSTLAFIRSEQFDDTLRIAKMLLNHPHDLIHKAVGWMLREVGKRDISVLRDFLAEHHRMMPRTALRYAIEKMDASERVRWMETCPKRQMMPDSRTGSHPAPSITRMVNPSLLTDRSSTDQ